jgi:hypothetical protein
MRHYLPAHAAQIADQGISLALRDGLVAEKAGRRQEPTLHASQRSLHPISEALH